MNNASCVDTLTAELQQLRWWKETMTKIIRNKSESYAHRIMDAELLIEYESELAAGKEVQINPKKITANCGVQHTAQTAYYKAKREAGGINYKAPKTAKEPGKPGSDCTTISILTFNPDMFATTNLKDTATMQAEKKGNQQRQQVHVSKLVQGHLACQRCGATDLIVSINPYCPHCQAPVELSDSDASNLVVSVADVFVNVESDIPEIPPADCETLASTDEWQSAQQLLDDVRKQWGDITLDEQGGLLLSIDPSLIGEYQVRTSQLAHVLVQLLQVGGPAK